MNLNRKYNIYVVHSATSIIVLRHHTYVPSLPFSCTCQVHDNPQRQINGLGSKYKTRKIALHLFQVIQLYALLSLHCYCNVNLYTFPTVRYAFCELSCVSKAIYFFLSFNRIKIFSFIFHAEVSHCHIPCYGLSY